MRPFFGLRSRRLKRLEMVYSPAAVSGASFLVFRFTVQTASNYYYMYSACTSRRLAHSVTRNLQYKAVHIFYMKIFLLPRRIYRDSSDDSSANHLEYQTHLPVNMFTRVHEIYCYAVLPLPNNHKQIKIGLQWKPS